MNLQTVIILGIACYRIVTLIMIEDGPYNLINIFRSWIYKNVKQEEFDKLGNSITNLNIIDKFFKQVDKGINCPWCLGIWIAFALSLLVYGLSINTLISTFAVAGIQVLIMNIVFYLDNGETDA